MSPGRPVGPGCQPGKRWSLAGGLWAGRSVAFLVRRVHAGGVVVQRLLAGLQCLLRLRAPAGAERIALAHPGEPIPQLDEIDLVLLKLRVGEVIRQVFLFHLGQEILAAVHDLFVLVVPRGLERSPYLGLTGQHTGGQQRRRPAHVQDLAAQLAHGPFRTGARWQRRRGVLQVDRAQALEPAPHRRTQAAGLGRYPVNEDQPALTRTTAAVSHAAILADAGPPATPRRGTTVPSPAPLEAT